MLCLKRNLFFLLLLFLYKALNSGMTLDGWVALIDLTQMHASAGKNPAMIGGTAADANTPQLFPTDFLRMKETSEIAPSCKLSSFDMLKLC